VLDGRGTRPLMTATVVDAPVFYGFLPVYAASLAVIQPLLQRGYALQFMGRAGWAPPGCALDTLRALKRLRGGAWSAPMQLLLEAAEWWEKN